MRYELNFYVLLKLEGAKNFFFLIMSPSFIALVCYVMTCFWKNMEGGGGSKPNSNTS